MVRRSILTLVLAVAHAHAYASPRTDPTAGRAVFTGATLASPTSISLNPAALGPGRIDRELTFGLAGLLEHLGIARRELDPASGEFVDGDEVKDVQAGGGGEVAFIWRTGSSVTLGADLRLPPPEMFPSATATRYHSRGTRQRNYVVSGGASLKLSSRFFFGFGISHDVTHLKLRYARDTGLDPGRRDCDGTPCGFENPEAAELYDVNVRSKYLSTENLRLNIGVLARVADEVWIGIAYHNSPGFGIQSELDGDMTVRQARRDGSALLVGKSTVFVSYPASVDAEVRAGLATGLDLHAGGRWEDLSRMQSYDVRAYGLAFRGENIPEWVLRPRGFRDAVALWAGIEQVETATGSSLRERLLFGGRIGIETSALQPDRTAPGTVAPTSLTLDVGTQIRIAPNWVLRGTYGFQYFPAVDVAGSEFDPRLALACEESGFDYTTRGCAALRNGYAIPTAAGEYTRFQHAMRLALTYEFP